MGLTAIEAKKAQPRDKAYKLTDGAGLHLFVKPNGSKLWRYKFRYCGKEKLLSLGAFPEVSIKEARTKHLEAKLALSRGDDPTALRRVEKLTRHIAAATSFEAVAIEWQERRLADNAVATQKRAKSIVNNYLMPHLKTRPIAEILPQELLAVLHRAQDNGTVDTAHRARQIAGQIFRYAVQTGRAPHDPTADLKGALTPNRGKHFAAITDPGELGKLLVAMDAYTGSQTVKAALLLSPLVFQRPGELRAMEWAEINWELRRWEIPAEKMKMGEPHIVPLSRQSLKLLQNIEPLTGHGQYVFPSARGGSRCMSDNTVRVALRTIGYS